MVREIENNSFALAIMAAVTLLNAGLAINFISANGRALAAAFNGQNIFLLAGVELIVVLTTYVVSKHRRIQLLTQTGNAVHQHADY
jgi:hypothetical protein